MVTMTQSLPAGIGRFSGCPLPGLSGMEAGALSSIIENYTINSVVILDIRPFLNYSKNHIINAVNVASTNLIQRRLKKGIISPLDLLKESKVEQQEIKSAIICHTEKGLKDFENPNTFAAILVEKLTMIFGDNTHYLQGGFESFSSLFPHLCTSCQTQCKVESSIGSEYSMPEPPRIINPISRITENIYISGKEDATDINVLQAHGITHIMNMTTDIQNKFVGSIHYCNIPALDSHRQSLKEFFKVAFAFIEAVREKGGRVLVHCHAGVSRSSTIVIAYLMWLHKWAFAGAISYVKQQRPCVDPNIGFIGQLMEFDREMNEINSDSPQAKINTLETTHTTGALTTGPWEFSL